MKIKILLVAFSVLLMGTCSASALPTLYDLTGDPDHIGIVDSGMELARVVDTSDPVESVTTIVLENAGYADENEFGIFNPNNPSEKLRVFRGYNDPGDSRTLVFDPANGQAWIDPYFPWIEPDKKYIDPIFGFYLESPDGTFYSVSSLNSDSEDHFLIFGVGGDDNVLYAAAEDQSYPGSDADFNDFVMSGTNMAPVNPVPEPMAMLTILFTGLGFLARKFKKA